MQHLLWGREKIRKKLSQGPKVLFRPSPNGTLVFPDGSGGKESACRAGDAGSILGSGGSPGEGDGNALQYSGLGNPLDGGTRWATVHGVSRTGHNLANKPPPPKGILAGLVFQRWYGKNRVGETKRERERKKERERLEAS